MDFSLDIPILQTCNKHNQQSVLFDPIKNEPICLVCLQLITGLVPPQSYQQKLNEIINKEKQNYITNKQLCQETHNSILNCKNTLITRFDKILQVIQDQMKIIDQHYSNFLQSIQKKVIQQKTIQQLEEEYQNYFEYNQQFKNQIKQQIDQLQKKQFTFDQLNPQTYKKPKIIINEQIQEKKRLVCDIIQQVCRKGEKSAHVHVPAFALDKGNSILVTADKREIIVYQFKNGIIGQELQRLDQHNTPVNCFKFMQLSDQFVSTSTLDQIIVWGYDNEINNWFAQYQIKFQEHSNYSKYKSFDGCIVINRNEDLIIFSDYEGVFFCKKMINGWGLHQSIQGRNLGPQLSLNQFGDKLIFYKDYNIFILMKGSNNDEWKIIQQINYGYVNGLFFTVGDQFVCQYGSANSFKDSIKLDFDDLLNTFEVFSWDQRQKCFKFVQQIILGKLFIGVQFSCQYIKQFNMISVFNGEGLSVLKINQEGNYQLMESIKLVNQYGRLTDDGLYLITINKISYEIQVRKLKFLDY